MNFLVNCRNVCQFPHNFGSRFTGEMRAVWEINQGAFGDGVELVLDWTVSRAGIRTVSTGSSISRPRCSTGGVSGSSVHHPVRHRRDDSPLSMMPSGG